jgi:diaminopimelate decarboxylase/aspartate kinase
MSLNLNYVVLKFGGTSQQLSTYKMILERIINSKKDNPNQKYVIVLSAITGITNLLIDYTKQKDNTILCQITDKNLTLAKQCNISIDDLLQDIILESQNIQNTDDNVSLISKGEFLTCNILDRYLNANKIKSKFISSLEVIFSTMENLGLYNKGEFKVDPNKILEQLDSHDVVVVPGFSGRTPLNKCCLLGRGGSDTTGSIIAAAINAKVYEIWTDVNGIYTGDPRKIQNTFINEIIDYDVAQEVAAMGAKVIHPFCILPCEEKSIPIHIKNTFNPYGYSTIICHNENNSVYGVTIQDNVKVFKITSLNMWNNYGFVYDIFSVFKEFNVDINIINTSQFNITTTTDEYDFNKLNSIKTKLEEKYNVELTFNNSIVSIVGNNIRLNDNIGNIFKLTRDFNLITTSYSSNDMTLSFVIETQNSIKLAQQLHDLTFFPIISKNNLVQYC